MAENAGNSRELGGTAPLAAAAGEVRALLRRARTAALATIDQVSGHPYASLVLVATAPDGTPLLLVSKLARHTRNLLADRRGSLLLDGTQGTADPLAGGRATLIGQIMAVDGAIARARFLSRHASAAAYVDFQDFAFYALQVETAHYVGGFGRIVELAAGDVLIATAGAEALIAAEPDILAHMNDEHAAAVSLYATQLLGAPAASWRITGIDPEGADLLAANLSARLLFDKPLQTPADAHRALVDLARAARGASLTGWEGLT